MDPAQPEIKSGPPNPLQALQDKVKYVITQIQGDDKERLIKLCTTLSELQTKWRNVYGNLFDKYSNIKTEDDLFQKGGPLQENDRIIRLFTDIEDVHEGESYADKQVITPSTHLSLLRSLGCNVLVDPQKGIPYPIDDRGNFVETASTIDKMGRTRVTFRTTIPGVTYVLTHIDESDESSRHSTSGVFGNFEFTKGAVIASASVDNVDSHIKPTPAAKLTIKN